ncbi:spermidine synthase [Fomitiporia mediterranea MF3/22]|uniref:spermidine synthase n=1 Tax=Fomitiporia mediterranea (strain MF3/22) TaxID=694068 RepID=UPI00044076C6|nr:spermidine synthase [Fomitiporia mediterranea MF3/22]EJC99425.1 spermidine synthase [Fomitiporia mediterranea MF3/22]
MAPLSHPSIVDGWFREISHQWPGQAMTLRVNKILHVEKSKYQDVLVFESATYGNVLVLDGAIQCTERDEYSYQEMIAHLPLASHPNPKKVLVIGGGDGGVVREVLKHESVENVVLCDIDEAVIRVSKQFLPHMSSLLSDPRVTVFIGDGFKYLADNTATYDVIITDSSDPAGPAASLFQKPYFQLIHDALTPGGHACSQGECLWIHLPLIHELRNTTKALFPTVEYAFTTIPTYPAGQIGFTMGAKEAGRDLKTPLRNVPNCRYYSADVHRAAFVLPEFGRSMLEDNKDITPVLTKTIGPEKKILLLGSGFVARPAAEYIVRNRANSLTIACRTLASAQALAEGLPNTSAISLDVNNTEALEKAVAAHDLVISLIPYTYHAAVIKAAIKGKTHAVTTSYISPAVRELDAEAKAAGIIVMNEIGLDPGIDHLYAVKMISEVHAKGGKIKQFLSYCGGLPSPAYADNPLGYKFSWSSRGVLLALLNPGSYYSEGKRKDVPGSELMGEAKPYFISPAYAFVAYPNRDSTPFRESYNIPEAETVVRGTLRYQGFPEFIQVLVKLGWLDASEKDWLNDSLTWAEVTQKAIGANDSSETSLIARIDALCSFPSDAERTRIISGLRWIGLFSQEKVSPRAGNLLDTLCAQLEKLMQYAPGERDLIMLQHKFVVEWADGKQDTITSTLELHGEPTGSGYSAMARTVGTPCGIATQLILDGVLNKTGVQAPYSMDIVKPIMEILESEGLGMVEKVL